MKILINSLLDLARLDSGNERTAFRSFDLSKTVRKTALSFESKLCKILPVAFYTDMPVMFLDNRLRNGKPQAIAAGLPASGIVNPVKTHSFLYRFGCQKPKH